MNFSTQNAGDTGSTLSPEGQQHVSKAALSRAQRAGGLRALVLRKLVGLVIVLVLLGAMSSGVGLYLINHSQKDNSDAAINKNEFQALFLTNGQVYFGKLGNLGDKYVSLTDIYYLQVQQSSTGSSSNTQTLQSAGNSTSSSSQVSLAKLGNELHGPEDKMSISSQQVLFWENLKGNSKVVQAINKYQQ